MRKSVRAARTWRSKTVASGWRRTNRLVCGSYGAPVMERAQSLRPNIRRRHAIAAAEGLVEVTEITEPGVDRHRTDLQVHHPRAGQHPVRARQTRGEHE